MKLSVVECRTGGVPEEFVLIKLGIEVFIFNPYILHKTRRKEKYLNVLLTSMPINVESISVNSLLYEAVRTHYLGIKNWHDNT